MWIGLHDSFELENPISSCSCDGTHTEACDACRGRFVWADGTAVTAIELWAENEPALFEKCVRLDNDGLWRGFRCEYEINYACSRGNTFF